MTILAMSDQAKRFLIETRQLFEAWRYARRQEAAFSGAMTWKKVGASEYLIRILNRAGKQKSLGPRSAETERIYVDFKTGKAKAAARVKQARDALAEQVKLNRAIGVGRMPLLPARIIRELSRRQLLGKNLIIVGTHAIYAYESLAAVRVPDRLMATGDLDVLWDARARLAVAGGEEDAANILAALRAVDRTFERHDRQTYRAVSASGFYVDLIKAEASPPWRDERDRMAGDDLTASPIINLKWLVNAPRIEVVAVDEKGLPVAITAPDPRAFALYKHWMGTQAPDRDPAKRSRDVGQAQIVAGILRDYLPQFPMKPDMLRMFPEEVVRNASEGNGLGDEAFWDDRTFDGPP